MRKPVSISNLLALATLVVLCTACDAMGASGQRAADESEGAVDRFFATLLGAGNEPIDVPAGTTLTVRLGDTLSSHATTPGTGFSAEVTQEVSVAGELAIPSGSVIHGHVTEAHPAKKIGGRAILSVAFDELTTPDGQTVALAARLAQAGKSEVARDAAIISGSTIGGAILGEALHEGEGTTVGAIAGAIGGTIGALKTKGKPVTLPAGTTLHITVDRPFSVRHPGA